MANLHDAFMTFHAALIPPEAAIHTLIKARNIIRKRIRHYFQAKLGLPAPKFHQQGACLTGTCVEPLSGRYSIDDAVYLQHLSPDTDHKWPAPETIHRLMVNAATVPGRFYPVRKKKCIRIPCSDTCHLNMTVYARLKGRFQMADCDASAWRPGDPLLLYDWFTECMGRYGQPLRRTILYFKAWADYQSLTRGPLPGGFIATILSAQHFRSGPNDDITFAQMLWAIQKTLKSGFQIPNPVNMAEDLADTIPDSRKDIFREALDALVADALEALYITDRSKASHLWRRQFGKRFPCI